MNREDWLTAAAGELAALLSARASIAPPAVHVSVGFPKGVRGRRGRAIGQCWPGSASTDGKPHVFVSPVLAEAPDVLPVLTHELIHAAGCDGHRGAFAKAAKAAGLIKPWTSSTAGPELTVDLAQLAGKLGPYPHAALTEKDRERPGSRLRLWVCACPVRVRVSSDDFQATCDICESPFERGV